MKKTIIGIIGLGHMGQALFKGLLNSGIEKSDFILSNKAEDNLEVIEKADWIFLAVKPNKTSEVLIRIPAQSRPKILISLVAGIKLKKLEQLVKDKNIRVVRIMPSLAISTGVGVIGLYKPVIPAKAGIQAEKDWIPDQVRDDTVTLLKEKLSALGEVIEVSERDLDLLTIISGCSPAIIAYFAQSFKDFSGKSEKLILKSLIGSLKYIKQSGLTFPEVIAAVATRGGITENILECLQENRVQGNVILALKSGYKKLMEAQND